MHSLTHALTYKHTHVLPSSGPLPDSSRLEWLTKAAEIAMALHPQHASPSDSLLLHRSVLPERETHVLASQQLVSQLASEVVRSCR